MQKFEIGKNDAGQRMDRYLSKLLVKAKKSLLQKSLRKKNITLNGKKAKAEDILKEGDWVEVYFSDETIEKFRDIKDLGEGGNLSLLYEDEDILLVEKPRGILTHSSQRAREDNMVDRLIHYLIQKGDYAPRLEQTFVPAFANRLDRNTSGILLAGKTAKGLRNLNQAIQKREIEKHYLLMVQGDLKKRQVVTTSGKKLEGKRKMVEGEDIDMKTIFTPLSHGAYSLIDAELVTGKFHQIRYHMQGLGYPIFGDKKYGQGGSGQWLHNYKLVFHTSGDLAYLKGRVFQANLGQDLSRLGREKIGRDFDRILKEIYGEKIDK